MRVKDIMTRNVEVIRPDAALQDAAGKMKQLNVGPLPVCENDRLVGMITDRDIAVRGVAEAPDAGRRKVRDVMTPDVTYCYEDDDVSVAARLMKDHQIRRLAVLDRENKRLVGIVSLGDLALETRDQGLSGQTLEAVSEPAGAGR